MTIEIFAGAVATIIISMLKDKSWPDWAKMLLTIVVSAALGLFATVITNEIGNWEQLLASSTLIFATSVTMYKMFFQRTGFNQRMESLIYGTTQNNDETEEQPYRFGNTFVGIPQDRGFIVEEEVTTTKETDIDVKIDYYWINGKRLKPYEIAELYGQKELDRINSMIFENLSGSSDVVDGDSLEVEIDYDERIAELDDARNKRAKDSTISYRTTASPDFIETTTVSDDVIIDEIISEEIISEEAILEEISSEEISSEEVEKKPKRRTKKKKE